MTFYLTNIYNKLPSWYNFYQTVILAPLTSLHQRVYELFQAYRYKVDYEQVTTEIPDSDQNDSREIDDGGIIAPTDKPILPEIYTFATKQENCSCTIQEFRKWIFSLRRCSNQCCPLSISEVRLGFYKEIGALISGLNSKNELTIVSYGSGELMTDYQILSSCKAFPTKIKYVLIDPIYGEEGNRYLLENFSALCQKIASEKGVQIEIHAYDSVQSYDHECFSKNLQADLILDIDTLLFDDPRIEDRKGDFQFLIRNLKEDGDFISLNTGGREFLSSYADGNRFAFHYIEPRSPFHYHGIPRIFSLKKLDRMDRFQLISLKEWNPLSNQMDPI